MVQVRACAKLNLFLAIGRKRKDGCHNLKTIFERISLSDRIILKSRPDRKIKISCSDSNVPEGRSNLCYKSASLLRKAFKINKGVDIRIIKRIPAGAGLGGGSSDAAAALMALNKLWKLKAPCEKLVKLAKKIGADVPFFLYKSHFALGSGRGDRIQPLRFSKVPRLWHILVVPRIKVSTPFIYKKWDYYSVLSRRNAVSASLRGALFAADRSYSEGCRELTKGASFDKLWASALRKKDLLLINRLLFNSLEPVTMAFYPSVARIKKKLRGLGLRGVLMSGSGPAVFALFSSREEAVSLSRRLKKGLKSWRVFLARTE